MCLCVVNMCYRIELVLLWTGVDPLIGLLFFSSVVVFLWCGFSSYLLAGKSSIQRHLSLHFIRQNRTLKRKKKSFFSHPLAAVMNRTTSLVVGFRCLLFSKECEKVLSGHGWLTNRPSCYVCVQRRKKVLGSSVTQPLVLCSLVEQITNKCALYSRQLHSSTDCIALVLALLLCTHGCNRWYTASWRERERVTVD